MRSRAELHHNLALSLNKEVLSLFLNNTQSSHPLKETAFVFYEVVDGN